MILRDGLGATFPVLFPSGPPAANLNWQVKDEDGIQLGSGSITPGPGAVSSYIPVTAALNTLTVGRLIGFRDVDWTYTTASGQIINDTVRYTIEARLPAGISTSGVRTKLGVSVVEVPDEEISLVKGFLIFQTIVGSAALAAAYDGGSKTLAIKEAVEALAARDLIPSMIVRVAVSEESGTNKFKRQDIDWLAVRAYLDTIITDGLVAVFPAYDVTIDFGPLFILARPATDAITGA